MRTYIDIVEAADWKSSYRSGMCDAMALALHSITHLPLGIIYVVYDDDGEEAMTPGHAVVTLPDGRYLDVDGAHEDLPSADQMVIGIDDIIRVELLPADEEEVRYAFSMEGVSGHEIKVATALALKDDDLRPLLLNFDNRSENLTENTSSLRAEMLNVFPRHVIKAGSLLYHGTSTREGFEIPDGPAWFAPTAVLAAKWAGWAGDHLTHGTGPKRVHVYEVTQDLDVADISKFPDSKYGKNDYEDFAHKFCGTDGYYAFARAVSLIDNGWWCANEIMIADPALFLRFAEASSDDISESEDIELEEATLIQNFSPDINKDMTLQYKQLTSSSKYKKITMLGDIKVMASDWPITNHAIVFLLDDKEAIGKFSIIVDRDFKPAITFKFAFLAPSHRKRGIGLALYSFFINSGMTIISDKEHTRGSKALWARLARDFTVQIIDYDGNVGKPVEKTQSVYHLRNRGAVLVASKNGFNPAGTITESSVIKGQEGKGGWISTTGEFHGLDRVNSQNHEEVAARFFEEIGDESCTSAALDAGWVRLYPEKSVMVLTWQRPLSLATKRTLMEWFSYYSPYFFDFEISACSKNGSYRFETFTDAVDAKRFIVQMTTN